ncbi:MAG: hydratase [Alphaproteobacteria bacterium]|nr:hydratase [Alphaproteobacteria bacterium]
MSASVEAAAALLLQARRERKLLPGLPAELRPNDLAGAYAIQAATTPKLLAQAGGGRVVGYKVGGTSSESLKMLGLPAPMRGPLLSPFVHDSPARIPADAFFIRVLEMEFGVLLGSDLPAGKTHTAQSVAEAVAAIVPAIEIADTRYDGWPGVGGLQIVADQASAGHWVKGREERNWRGLDLANHAVTFSLNGAEKARGNSSAVLGHPFASLAWLANAMAEAGSPLKAGDYVTTGSAGPVLRCDKGDTAVADFGRLGQVSVSFV